MKYLWLVAGGAVEGREGSSGEGYLLLIKVLIQGEGLLSPSGLISWVRP